MKLKETVLRSPLKGILHRAYRMKKEEEYRRAFEKRIREIRKKAENPEIEDKINVLIVVADCLRFKNTSLSGYERDTTPFLASLKNSGKATAAAPWTHPSVASIMTGLYPHNHGAYIHSKVRNFDYPKHIKGIRRKLLTLPEIAALNGYEVYFGTSIEVATFPMKGRTPLTLYPAETRGDTLVRDFLRWLKNRNKRAGNFFAYLHLGDTHEPLVPPREFRHYFGEVEKLPGIDRWRFQRPEEQRGERFERFKRNKILLYDNTVRYVDWLFQRVHEELDSRNLLDCTVLIFTADHGEEFWEHAKLEAKNFYDPRGIYGVGHGHNVFNEILEVPLVFDGATAVRRMVMRKRSLVDIFPTILDLWKVENLYQVEGVSLFRKPGKFLLSEATGYGYEKKALITDDLKLLYAPEDGVEWLFMLDRDRRESRPVKEETLTEPLKRKLLSLLAKDEMRMRTQKFSF